MTDFDFLDGFDSGGDWGFTSVSEKPSDTAKKTETVVKQTAVNNIVKINDGNQ